MKNRFLFLVGIGALLAMSSCSKDEENLVVKSGEPATLKLTIKGSDLSTKATVSASDLTDAGESFDNNINNIVVGVFRDDGDVLNGYADAIGDVLVSEVTASNPRAFYIPSGSEIKVTAGKRDIIVVANASDADIIVLKTATTKSDFLKKVLVLADKEQSKDKLLMTGVKEDADITKGIINPISLEVTRLVGRVQLVSLKSLFKDSYANAVLEVDKIFLHNALFNYPVDPSLTNPYTKRFYTGYNPASTSYPEIYDPKLMDATTYSLSGSSADVVTSSNHYFYTFPNGRSDLSTELDLTTATKLVISGKFYPNGTSGEFTYVYYPIVINKDVDATQARSGYGIERNYVYSISATIFRPGVVDPDKPLDPASISLTITVANWNNITQSNDL
jgi:hypothetical protein